MTLSRLLETDHKHHARALQRERSRLIRTNVFDSLTLAERRRIMTLKMLETLHKENGYAFVARDKDKFEDEVEEEVGLDRDGAASLLFSSHQHLEPRQVSSLPLESFAASSTSPSSPSSSSSRLSPASPSPRQPNHILNRNDYLTNNDNNVALNQNLFSINRNDRFQESDPKKEQALSDNDATTLSEQEVRRLDEYYQSDLYLDTVMAYYVEPGYIDPDRVLFPKTSSYRGKGRGMDRGRGSARARGRGRCRGRPRGRGRGSSSSLTGRGKGRGGGKGRGKGRGKDIRGGEGSGGGKDLNYYSNTAKRQRSPSLDPESESEPPSSFRGGHQTRAPTAPQEKKLRSSATFETGLSKSTDIATTTNGGKGKFKINPPSRSDNSTDHGAVSVAGMESPSRPWTMLERMAVVGAIETYHLKGQWDQVYKKLASDRIRRRPEEIQAEYARWLLVRESMSGSPLQAEGGGDKVGAAFSLSSSSSASSSRSRSPLVSPLLPAPASPPPASPSPSTTPTESLPCSFYGDACAIAWESVHSLAQPPRERIAIDLDQHQHQDALPIPDSIVAVMDMTTNESNSTNTNSSTPITPTLDQHLLDRMVFIAEEKEGRDAKQATTAGSLFSALPSSTSLSPSIGMSSSLGLTLGITASTIEARSLMTYEERGGEGNDGNERARLLNYGGGEGMQVVRSQIHRDLMRELFGDDGNDLDGDGECGRGRDQIKDEDEDNKEERNRLQDGEGIGWRTLILARNAMM